MFAALDVCRFQKALSHDCQLAADAHLPPPHPKPNPEILGLVYVEANQTHKVDGSQKTLKSLIHACCMSVAELSAPEASSPRS